MLLKEGQNQIRVSVTYIDPEGKVIAVYQDYKVIVDLGEIIIETDLKDCTVETESIVFTAKASLGGEEVPLKVTCEGESLDASGHKYTAKLDYGDNLIVLEARQGKHSARLEYNVKTSFRRELGISTDLKDQTYNYEDFSFYAEMVNGTKFSRFTVVLNGKTITQSDPHYKVKLDIGQNVIRLKATDRIDGEKITVVEQYRIKYVPLATEETAPKMKYINVWDGMHVPGKEFKLDVQPVDYLGNRIYYNGITVKLNSEEIHYKWSSEYTSYALYFKVGANDLKIRLTDKDGRFADFAYTIYCDSVDIGDHIGDITMSIDANVLGLPNIVAAEEVPIFYGDNGAETLLKFLKKKGFTCTYSGAIDDGFYIVRIHKTGMASGAHVPEELVRLINKDGIAWTNQEDDDSLGEFDYTRGSGWMYTINDSFPNHGFSDAIFMDGDVVRLRFTLAFGKDIGGYTGEGSNYPIQW